MNDNAQGTMITNEYIYMERFLNQLIRESESSEKELYENLLCSGI